MSRVLSWIIALYSPRWRVSFASLFFLRRSQPSGSSRIDQIRRPSRPFRDRAASFSTRRTFDPSHPCIAIFVDASPNINTGAVIERKVTLTNLH
jgi:hypothetical protein